MCDGFVGARVSRFGIGFIVLPFVAVMRTDSSRHRTQPTEAKEVVGGTVQVSEQLRARNPSEPALSKAAHGLEPPEDLLDAFALSLRDGVAGVTRGAAIEPRGLAVLDGRDVRGDTAFSQPRDELACVVGLVGTDGLRFHLLPALARQQIQGAGPPGGRATIMVTDEKGDSLDSTPKCNSD